MPSSSSVRRLLAVALVLFVGVAAQVPQEAALAAPRTVTVASGTVAISGTKWRAVTVASPVTGAVQFSMSWTGTGDLDTSLKSLPGQVLVTSATDSARPKVMTANLTQGTNYQLAVWAQTGSGTYTVTMTYDDGAPAGNSLQVASGTVDQTRATAPDWVSYPFTAPVSGAAEARLTWTNAPADLRFSIKDAAGTVIASNTAAGAGPKTSGVQLTQGAAYRFNVWAFAGVSPFVATLSWAATPPAGPPNIVIVNTDDQRPDTLAYLPRITSLLVNQGTTFTDAYTTTPACCPSRATLMSGRYVHNNGQFQQQNVGVDLTLTVQRYLQQAGYLTGHAGKYIHWWELADGVAPYWDRWTYFKGGYNDVMMNFDGQTRRSSGYSTTIVFDKAIEYLDDFETRDDAAPWYLSLAPIAPHDPSIPEPKYANAPVPAQVPTPETNETDRSDKPLWVRNNNVTVASIAPTRTAMIRTLYTVDDQVGRLIDYLVAHGEMSNTLFVFTSDNGTQWAEHGLQSKFLPYPDSIGIPLVIRWDGKVAAGATDDRKVAQLDVTATVLAAAGVPPTSLLVPIDGHDLRTDYRRQIGLAEYWQDDNNNKVIPNWATITTDTFQYTEYYEPEAPDTVTYREYYDLVADPHQLTNLFGDSNPANDPAIAPLHSQLVAQKTCAATSCG